MPAPHAESAGADAALPWLAALSRRVPPRGPGRWLARQLRRAYLRGPRADDVAAEVGGLRMRLRPGDYVEGQLLFAPHGYEAEERAWVGARLRPGDVFVDLGAHAGLYTLLAARAVGPSGLVVAVEANPETFARLVGNVRANRFANVRCLACGVSDRSETLSLGRTRSTNSGAASFLARGDGEVRVECVPLVALLEQAGVARVAGMKLDIEGFEHRVLRAFFAEAPPAWRPDFVLVEHKPHLTERAGGDALALLREQGYRIAFRARGRRGWRNYGLVRTVGRSADG